MSKKPLGWTDFTFGQLFGACIASALIILLAVVIFAGDQSNRLTWVGLYVVTALATGSTFWVINPLEKQGFTWTKLGIQFGGAAAIGAGFMAMAHKFTPPPQPSVQLVSLNTIDEKFRKLPTFRLTTAFTTSEPPLMIPVNGIPSKVLVHFAEGATSAEFECTWVEPPKGEEQVANFTVDRNGTVTQKK